jgi:hypothetical protein
MPNRRYGFGWKDLFRGKRKGASPEVRKFLEEHKGSKIVKLRVGRQPISAPLAKAINVLTGGRYERTRRQKGYDDFNHVFAEITLNTGETFKIEKNHVVEVQNITHDKSYGGKKYEVTNVELNRMIPVSEFLSNGERYQDQKKAHNFWEYDAATANCQYFVDDLVEGNKDAIARPEQTREFYFQPGAEEAVGPARNISKSLTDLAAYADTIVHGQGMHRHARRRHRDSPYYKL